MNARRMVWLGAVCVAMGLARGPAVAAPGELPEWALENTPLNRSAEELKAATADHIARAEEYRQKIVSADGPRTIENTLEPYNDMMMHLDAAVAEAGLFANVHPDKAVREAGDAAEQEVSAYLTKLGLDRPLFESFKSLDVSKADGATKYLVFKVLRDFRRAGVEQPDDVRAKIQQLNEEIVKIGQEFGRNIREDTREITLDSVADLEGMPADWIKSHAPGEDGKIHVNTQYPDYLPFMTYAKNGPARLALYKEFKNVGYPQNIEVLQKLLNKRHELATTLGYKSWADYITEDKMIGSAAKAQSFIDEVLEKSRPAVQREYAVLLERKKKDDPSATKVEDWEKMYYEELVKTETLELDSQEVREYLDFKDAQQGLFALTGRMFGVQYKPVSGLKLWHPSVTAWDVYDGDKLLGRFYLDLHPRENKYNHAACFDFREGIAGKRLPQKVLVCNFPDPEASPDGLGLMQHDDVETFFHEFGHLIHGIFAGHQKWMGNSGISTEWDFVEAPSQLLEEWAWSYDTLQLFAKHHKTRETIPVELVERMNKARNFGKGLFASHQMFYAALSLNLYNADPATLDSTDVVIELQDKYSAFDYVDGTHFQCNFGHLDGYSAIYYTYMWSLVIAKDMFSEFERTGVLNEQTAQKYRQCILEPGGSKPAADLVKDFLGRPYSFDSFTNWLNRT